MEEYLQIASVPVIAAVVYWIINIVKYAVGENKTFRRFIPLTAALLGSACGVVCFYAVPGILPAGNVVSALVMGAASGLSATGADQLIRQLKKTDPDKDGEKQDPPEKS